MIRVLIISAELPCQIRRIVGYRVPVSQEEAFE